MLSSLPGSRSPFGEEKKERRCIMKTTMILRALSLSLVLVAPGMLLGSTGRAAGSKKPPLRAAVSGP